MSKQFESYLDIAARKTEQQKIKDRESYRKLRRDARAARTGSSEPRALLMTPEAIKQREYQRKYRETHREERKASVSKSQKAAYLRSKDRIREAIAQAEATQRNVERLEP